MRDELNPYASPVSKSARESSSLRAPRRIWLTRAIDAGLVVNLALLPVFLLLETTSDALRRGDWDGLAFALEALCEASLVYAGFACCPFSLFALRYTALTDRGTRWWRTKCVIAALTALLGLLVFVGDIWYFFYFLQ